MRGRLRAWMDRHRFTTSVAIAVLVVAPGYFRLEQLIHHQAMQATRLEQLVAAQAAQVHESQRAGCINQNEVYGKINNLITLSAQPRNGVTRTPAQQAAAVAALQPFLIPYRDCSDKGLAKYFSTNGKAK